MLLIYLFIGGLIYIFVKSAIIAYTDWREKGFLPTLFLSILCAILAIVNVYILYDVYTSAVNHDKEVQTKIESGDYQIYYNGILVSANDIENINNYDVEIFEDSHKIVLK